MLKTIERIVEKDLPGFIADGNLVVRKSEARALKPLNLGDAECLAQLRKASSLISGGRGGAAVAKVDGLDGRLVIRHFKSGSPFRKILGDQTFQLARPLNELIVSEAARKAGVPTPECVAAVIQKKTMRCSFDIIMREVPEAATLEDWIRGKRTGDLHPALVAAADSFRKLCGANIYHPDLHAGNILITGEGDALTAWIIDLDRARLFKVLPRQKRDLMLFRFNRALVKRKLAPEPVTPYIFTRFAMMAGVPQDEMESFLKRCSRHLKIHSWKY